MSFPRPSLRALERSLAAIACGSLGFCLWVWLDAGFYQRMQGMRLDRLIAGLHAGTRTGSRAGIARATRSEVEATGLVGRIEIPRLGVHAIVAEGTDPRTLRRSVGHVAGTALPGEPGNTALAGHRDSFFVHLKDLRLGDRVRVTTPDGVFEYRVDSRSVVEPDQTEVLASSGEPTLTLITCFPFGYVGAAPERFIVRASQVAAKGDR
jgi:sortase A